MRFYQQFKNIYHYLQAHLWRAYYRWPDRHLHIYGVTGTNGKTTTCHLVASILQAQHGVDRVGMLTTIAFWIGAKKITNETKMTTLPSRAVFAYLYDMRRTGVTHAVIELTSHALDQHRLAGIQLDGAIMLNIAREHLDYHQTMAAYAQAKGKIVRYLKPNSPLVVKGDDEWISKLLSGLRIADYPASGRDPANGGGQLQLIKFTSAQAHTVTTSLPGEVNKENTLAATLLARAIGIPEETITTGAAQLSQIPGRMQWLELPTGARALIDYAVTPDALSRLYKDMRAQTNGKIFAVLGAAGLRDRGKRPDMARAVAQFADELIITREDPWTENEEQIFHDLEQGLNRHCEATEAIVGNNGMASSPTPRHDCSCIWRRIVDRAEALRYCLRKAGPGDVVVATGKGAETGMGIGKKVVPWNEREIILEIANNLAKSQTPMSNAHSSPKPQVPIGN